MVPDPDLATQQKLCVFTLENSRDESCVQLQWFFFFLPSLETEMTANVNIHKMLKIDGWLIRINNAPSSLSSFGAPHGQPCSSSQPQFSCSSCTSRIWWRGRAPRSRR